LTTRVDAPTKEKMKAVPGFKTLCVHKGLSTTAGREPELGHPMDIPKAARLYPDFNFVIYHACIRPGFWVRNALKDIEGGILRNARGEVGPKVRNGVPDILWSTEFAYLSAPFKNVYAEIGTTFASCVITFPTVAAHLFGQFMKIMGDDRIVFGSDSVHYGAPQWQIDALWRFQIPERIREKWGYPELTKEAKKKILGLNSARIYKLPTGVDDDEYERGFGGRDDEEEQRDVLYKPVPSPWGTRRAAPPRPPRFLRRITLFRAAARCTRRAWRRAARAAIASAPRSRVPRLAPRPAPRPPWPPRSAKRRPGRTQGCPARRRGLERAPRLSARPGSPVARGRASGRATRAR